MARLCRRCAALIAAAVLPSLRLTRALKSRVLGRSAARIGLSLLLVTLGGVSTERALSGQRSASAPQRSGADVIVGTVVDASDGLPVADASVHAQAGPGYQVVVLTDGRGRFLFRDLPQGTFNVVVIASGYLSGFGGGRPTAKGQGATLAADVPGPVTIPITRAAALSGTVTDELDEPVSGSPVVVLRVSAGGGRGVGPSKVYGQLDDRGMFRVAGLAPGDYVIGFVAPSLLPHPPALFYPHAASAAEATTVTVGPGEERTGIDMRLDATARQNPLGSTLVMPLTQTGTASIRGTVASDPGGRPVRHAVVGLTAAEGGLITRIFTDGAGGFVFDRLPAGRYTLDVTKTGNLPLSVGAARPGLPGTVAVVRDAEAFDIGTLTMARAAVITGVVSGPSGRPMAGALVQVVAIPPPGGVGRPLLAGSAGADDRGVYRVSGLRPGAYIVQARASTGRETTSYIAEGPASTGMVETRRPTEAEYRWANQPSSTTKPPAGEAVIFAPVFYPGLLDIANAVPVTVEPGEEQSGVNVALQLVRAVSIRGVVVAADGHPWPGARVGYGPPAGADPGPFDDRGLNGTSGQTITKVEGTFVFTEVAPGLHEIKAIGTAGSEELSAETDVQIREQDVAGVRLGLEPSPNVSGRIVFERSAPIAAPDVSAVRVEFVPAAVRSGLASAEATAAKDGSFTVRSLFPAAYRADVHDEPVGWYPRSVVLNGRDALDQPIAIPPGGNVDGLVVTLTDRMARISGTLVDESGQPASRFYLELFPQDSALWDPGSRRIKVTRAATDGRFVFDHLPAGDYYLSALTDYEPTGTADLTFLGELAVSARKITVADGENKIQNLKVGGG